MRLSLGAIAAEIDRTPADTAKLLRKTSFIGWKARNQKITTYDSSALEVLKAMLGQPHRVISDSPDWLSDFINKGGKHG